MSHTRHRASEPSAAILQAATHVFASRGFAGATIEEIATRAGFSHQTVRDRFVDKRRLWRAVQRSGWDQLLAGVARRVARGTSPAERLRGSVEALAQVAVTSRARARLLMRCDPVCPNTDDVGDLHLWLTTLFADAGTPRANVYATMVLAAMCAVCGCQHSEAAASPAVFDDILRLALVPEAVPDLEAVEAG